MTGALALVAGGAGEEAVYSIKSAAWIRRELDALCISYEMLFCASPAELKRHIHPDREYLLLFHGGWGEGGVSQRLLERKGVRFSGSSSQSSRLCMDKKAAKLKVASAGVSVPKSLERDEFGKRFQRAIIKPRFGGSSIGVALVKDAELIALGLENCKLVVEEFVAGHIVTVAIKDVDGTPTAFNPICIEPITEEFYSENVKAQSSRRYLPASDRLSNIEIDFLKTASVAAFIALGCRGVSRADFIVKPDGEAVFLEMNTIPGLGEQSNILACYRASDRGAKELVVDLLESIVVHTG